MTATQVRAPRWWALRLVVAAAACLLAVLVPMSPAAAHATLIGTDPAEGAVLQTAPGEVTFTFSEPVVLADNGVRVFDAEGDPIEADAAGTDEKVVADLPADLAEGTYVVAWRVVSTDGHPIAGTLSFSIGRPSAQVVPPDVAATSSDPAVKTAMSVASGVTYLASLLAAGLAVFVVLVLPSGSRAEVQRRRVRSLLGAAAVVAALGGVVAAPLTVIDQQGLRIGDVLDPDVWLTPSTASLSSLILLLIGLVLLREAVDPRTSPAGARFTLALGLCAVAVSPAVTGHTRAAEPLVLVLAADVLHVLAGSVWLGGLVGLAMVLPGLAGRGPLAARVLTRFSALAAAVLVALLVSGAVLTWRIVGSWSALLETGHGQLLLAKSALVAGAVLLAAANRFVLLPRAARDRGCEQGRLATVRLARVAAMEAAVLVGVIAVTGFLVNQPPGQAPAAVADGRTGVVEAELGGEHTVLAVVDPGRVGANTVRIQLQDLDGEPFEPGRPPTVSLRSDDLDLGEVRAVSDAVGTYRASVVLPAPGRWRLQVSVRLSEFDNPVAVLELDVEGADPTQETG